MSDLLTRTPQLRLAIREIGVAAASPIAARRLADALPAAIEQALTRLRTGARAMESRRQTPAERAAAQIARAVAQKLGARP